jgi:hypothetical protein
VSASVGTSGNWGVRMLLPSASAVILPALMCGITLPMPISAIGVVPDSTAVVASPPPRNGTRTQSAPLSFLRCSM